MKAAVGLGLRHSFHGHVLEQKPAVPFFEIITENYLYFDGAPRRFLKQVREHYPLVFHGVSLSIGSLEPVRIDYLTQLKKMIEEFQPLWVSDHLCWTFNGPENSHDLLPVPFTKESLERIVSKTQQVQDFLGHKIYLENPSAYVDFKDNSYSEESFIAELCKSSGCGLLLDLNNLVVNHYNLGYDPINYLNTIRQCDVKQIHLAGHTIKENVRIDTHDREISQEVLDLLPIAKTYWPEANPMIEWDDKIPPIDHLLHVRRQLQSLWSGTGMAPNPPTPTPLKNPVTSVTDSTIYQSFWNTLKARDYITQADVGACNILKQTLPTPAHVGMNVYSSAYYNRQIEVLGNIFPALKTALDELFSDVAMEYLEHYPSTFASIDFIGNNLARFITEHGFAYNLGVDKLIVADIAAFESAKNLALVAFAENHPAFLAKNFTESDWGGKRLKVRSEVMVQTFNSEIHHAVEAIQNGEIPAIPELKRTSYVFYRQDQNFSYQKITNECTSLLSLFSDFSTFSDAVNEKSPDNIRMLAELLIANEKLFCVEKEPKLTAGCV